MICIVDGCNLINGVPKKGGYCSKHKHHIQRYGFIKKITKYSPNEIIKCKDYCEIILRDKNEKELCRAIIDSNDIDLISKYKWGVKFNKGKYYVRNVKNKIYLHQLIMNSKGKGIIDHINHNPLDNRKLNLRFANSKINNINISIPSNNTSGVVGVVFDKTRNKWKSQIFLDYKNKFLGRFDNFEDAVKVRQDAELKYFGEVIKR